MTGGSEFKITFSNSLEDEERGQSIFSQVVFNTDKPLIPFKCLQYLYIETFKGGEARTGGRHCWSNYSHVPIFITWSNTLCVFGRRCRGGKQT